MDQRPLTIGIDARAAVEVPAGRGRVVRELLRELALRDEPHTYRCYARTAWEEPVDERFEWSLSDASDPWWNFSTARRASRECDVFLSSNSYLTMWTLTVPGIPIVYDMTTFESSMRPNRRSAIIERLTLRPAVRRAAALLCISQATADALIAQFPSAAGLTVVAPLGAALASPDDLTDDERSALPAPGAVLAVGTLEPRKNLPRLVAAYRALPESLQDRHPLVVVGALGWETGETLDALHSLGDRCTMLGHVSEAVLAELYRRCAVFCYPSLGEGFGLPVLEAMTAGAAVVTSDVSSLPEVGGDAVAYADPRDVAGISAAIERVLTDAAYREDLSTRALRRAGEFSWSRFAATVLKSLQDNARAD